MQKMSILDIFNSEEQRKTERVVAIYTQVSPDDWSKIPALCKSFLRDLDTSLEIYPVVVSDPNSFEVWFSLVEDHVDLDAAASYITGYFGGSE